MEQETHARGGETHAAQPLAWILALAYLLVIVYASLQPFSGWRIPPEEIRRFLTAPWPQFITLQDVLVNIFAYVPLAFLFTTALLARHSQLRAALNAIALSMVLSSVMEVLQSFMPTRVASNVDVLANTLGAVIGALAAPLFAQTHKPGIRLAELRRQWFVYGGSAEIGVVIVALWLVTQFNPMAQLFATGDVRGTLDLPAWFFHTPQALVASQATIAALNMIGIGAIVLALTRESMPRIRAVAAILTSAVALKMIAGLTMTRGAGLLAWLTPGVAAGAVVAALIVYALTRLPRRAQWIVAAASFAGAVAAVNFAPDNPYQTLPPQMLAQGPTHFLSFSSMVRALSELWPFLALAYTIVAAGERPSA